MEVSAINRILELAPVEEIETDEGVLYDRDLHLPPAEPVAKSFNISTLVGLAAFANSALAAEQIPEGSFVLVHEAGLSASLKGPIEGRHQNRACFAKAMPPGGTVSDGFFGQWHDAEMMVISLRTLFQRDRGDHLDQLIEVLAGMKHEDSTEVQDDGISQRVATRRGGSSLKEWADMPSTVVLHPFRVFPGEIDEQPRSEFVVRVRSSHQAIEVALFEADGGAWRVEAGRLVGEKLSELIEGVPVLG